MKKYAKFLLLATIVAVMSVVSCGESSTEPNVNEPDTIATGKELKSLVFKHDSTSYQVFYYFTDSAEYFNSKELCKELCDSIVIVKYNNRLDFHIRAGIYDHPEYGIVPGWVYHNDFQSINHPRFKFIKYKLK
jgi:hypothetical protein